MVYYLGYELETKPFVGFIQVAKSTAELTALGLATNPLVVTQLSLPSYEFGVCTWKIVDGEFVERGEVEMREHENAWELRMAVFTNTKKIDDVNTGYFIYDGKTFPMDEASRLFYACIEKLGSDHHILTTSGEDYFLVNEDDHIANFMTAYYSKLLELTKHIIP